MIVWTPYFLINTHEVMILPSERRGFSAPDNISIVFGSILLNFQPDPWIDAILTAFELLRSRLIWKNIHCTLTIGNSALEVKLNEIKRILKEVKINFRVFRSLYLLKWKAHIFLKSDIPFKQTRQTLTKVWILKNE